MTTFNADFHPQHAPSNSVDHNGRRAMSDSFLIGQSSHYNASRNSEEIEKLAGGAEFIKVTDVEIEEIRKATNNTLARGDAIELVLYKKMLAYPGLIDHNDEGDIKARSGISTALYSEQDAATYYFLEDV